MPGTGTYTRGVAKQTSRAPWQSWLILLGALAVGGFLVASRIKPAAVVGVAIIVVSLLIVLRMSIEAFGSGRRR